MLPNSLQMTQMSQSQSTTQSFTIEMESQAVKALKALVGPLTQMLQVTAELKSSTEAIAKHLEAMSRSTDKLSNCTLVMLEQVKGTLERLDPPINHSKADNIQPQIDFKPSILNTVKKCLSEPGSNPSSESIVLPKIDTFIEKTGLQLKTCDTLPISVRNDMFMRIIDQAKHILKKESLTSKQHTDIVFLRSKAIIKLSRRNLQPSSK